MRFIFFIDKIDLCLLILLNHKVMKKWIFYILFIFVVSNCFAQTPEFEFPLYFEDAAGNKDTITLGYDALATDSIDTIFGEINTLNQPWSDSTFEVRITDKMIHTLWGDPMYETFRTKKQIIEKQCGKSWGYWHSIDIDIKNAVFPVNITYNDAIANNSCIYGSRLGVLDENIAWDMGFYGYIMGQSYVMSIDTSYLSYQDIDGKSIYSFWIRFGDSTLLTLGNTYNLASDETVIYPNPFTDNFTISSTPSSNNIEITDLSGKTIPFEQSGNTIYPLCPSGIYIIMIRTDSNINVYKILKQ